MATSLQVMNKRLVLLNPVSMKDLSDRFFVQKFIQQKRLQTAQPMNRGGLDIGQENQNVQ